jgi:hypothetical protein
MCVSLRNCTLSLPAGWGTGDAVKEELTQNLPILRIRSHPMDHGEAELSFCEILRKAFIVGIFSRLEVHIVVTDLKVD